MVARKAMSDSETPDVPRTKRSARRVPSSMVSEPLPAVSVADTRGKNVALDVALTGAPLMSRPASYARSRFAWSSSEMSKPTVAAASSAVA
jgi:hypothetical protein